MRRVELHVSGRVQGVFYRDSTRQQAERLGVTGWVRNLPDGRVEAQLQGSDEAVDHLLDWCYSGPPHARVTDVRVQNLVVVSDESTFTIR